MNINPYFLVGDKDLLLSFVEITVGRGHFLKKVNCLLDTGSQRSYLSDKVLDVLSCRSAPISKRDCIVKTFLGSTRKSLREIVLRIELLDSGYSVLFQEDEDLDVEFQDTGLSAAVQRF